MLAEPLLCADGYRSWHEYSATVVEGSIACIERSQVSAFQLENRRVPSPPAKFTRKSLGVTTCSKNTGRKQDRFFSDVQRHYIGELIVQEDVPHLDNHRSVIEHDYELLLTLF